MEERCNAEYNTAFSKSTQPETVVKDRHTPLGPRSTMWQVVRTLALLEGEWMEQEAREPAT